MPPALVLGASVQGPAELSPFHESRFRLPNMLLARSQTTLVKLIHQSGPWHRLLQEAGKEKMYCDEITQLPPNTWGRKARRKHLTTCCLGMHGLIKCSKLEGSKKALTGLFIYLREMFFFQKSLT